MKTIGLMLTRNEEHLLPYTLPPLAQICDHIIIADQHSTDDTRAIIKKCNKAILVENPPSPPDGNYDTQGRNLLLDTARNFDGNNLIICIDADEIAPPNIFRDLKEYIASRYKIGTGFQIDWVRLWKKNTRYCPPWNHIFHSIRHAKFFYDDRQYHHGKTSWVHGGSIPTPYEACHYLPHFEILHFHWVFWQRALWQHAWYHMMEFKNARFDKSHIHRINRFYSDPALHGQKVITRRLPQKLRQGYQPPPPYPDNAPNWRKDEIWQMIEKHGIEIFEPLNIWYVSELKEHFEQEMKRPPQWQRLPKINLPLSQLSHATQWEARRKKLRETIKKPERRIRPTLKAIGRIVHPDLKAFGRKIRQTLKAIGRIVRPDLRAFERRMRPTLKAIVRIVRPDLKAFQHRIRQTTWYKKLKGKKT